MINCECHDSRMVAQQRKEILMLTAELTNQSNEIENQIARNNKLRNKIKTNEKEKHDFECRVRSLLKEISTLKDERSKFDAELDSIKKSLVKKDQLIQSQSVKYQQLSIDCERFKKQLAEYQTKNNELKAENLKLKQTVKDQSNKVAETKIKENELLKIIENKNELIKLSANQIKLLEGNLTNLANMMIVSNSQKCDLSSSNKQSAASSIQDNNNNSKEILVTTPKTPIKEDNMQSNNNNVQDEIHVNSLIKSLKETWLESNLKYEEIKNLIISRLPTQGQLVANNNNNRSSTPTSDQI